MESFIQILSDGDNTYSINLANVVKVKKTKDGGMYINFTSGEDLKTKTTYDEFLKLTGQNNKSKYNNPEEESFI